MKFRPGDIAWVRRWYDEWETPEGRSGWALVLCGGIEQVVTVLDNSLDDECDYAKTTVLTVDGESFYCAENCLLDEKAAAIARREMLLNNRKNFFKFP